MSRLLGSARFLQGLNGSWRYLGTIDATTGAKTNATATTPFTITAGATICFQPTVVAHVSGAGGTLNGTADPTITASNAPRFDAYCPPVVLTLRKDQDKIAAILPSSTGNVLVWALE